MKYIKKIGKNKNNTFAYGFNFYKFFWVFLIASIIGIVVEEIWTYLNFGVLESKKGLIYLPLSPIYGYGAVIMTICASKFSKKKNIYIFLLCMIIGAFFEWVCSFFQESVLHTISWDYSNTPFNFGGRTNLLFSFFWGILGLFFVKYLYPKLSNLIEKIPKKPGTILTWILFILIVFDTGISAFAVSRQSARHYGIEPTNKFEKFLDTQYTDEKLKKIFPGMAIIEK